MKNIYLLLLLVLPAASVKAQQQSRLIAKMELDYDTTFHPSDSFTYVYYDGRGSDMKTGDYKFDTSVHYQWPSDTLTPYERILQQFYGDRKLKEKVTQYYLNNQWANQFKETYYYNGSGNVDSIVKEQWNPFNMTWGKLSRLRYQYNGAQKLVLLENQSWNFGSYLTLARTTYNYNLNNLTRVTSEEFDQIAGTWFGSEQHSYTYFSNNLLYSDSLQTWDAATSGWVHQHRNLYKYDASNNIDTLTEQDWDPTAAMYTIQYLHAYNYNANKDVTTDSFYIWDQTNSVWQHARNFYNTYDANNNLLQALEEAEAGGTFTNYRKQEWTYNSFSQPLLFLAYSWDAATSAWVYLPGADNQLRYYYQEFDPTKVTDVRNKTSFTVYPNPASQFINIRLDENSATATISIWGIDGKMLKLQQMQGAVSNNIHIGNLPSGNYIIKVTTGDKEMTKQLWIAP